MSNETALTVLEANMPSIIQMALAFMPKGSTQDDAMRRVAREVAAVEQLWRMKPELAGCKKDSFVYAVKQCIQDGLTLAPSAGLAYIIPSKIKTGTAGSSDVYEWVAVYEPTGEGMLSMARQAGRIFDNTRPECIYDESGRVMSVTVSFLIPSHNSTRWDTVTFGPGHFNKWQKASHKKNCYGKPDADHVTLNYANANYTSFNGGIDPEFAGTKAIVHGLAKRGINMDEPQREIQAAPQKWPTKNNMEMFQKELQSTRVASVIEDVSHKEIKLDNATEGKLYVQTHEIINPEDL